MSSYNTDNMAGFLGSDCTDEDAEQFASYLENNGWTLFLGHEAPETDHDNYEVLGLGANSYRAFRQVGDGEWQEMDENEWQEALAECFK